MAYNLAKVRWLLTEKYVFIHFYPSYQIALPLAIPSWRYGWKFEYLAKILWTLTFHLYWFMSIFVYSHQSFQPNLITTEHS